MLVSRRDVGITTLESTSDVEHGLDGTKTPIVVILRREEFLVELVESDELESEILGITETFSSEHDFTNVLQVGNDHGAGAEESLDVLGEFSTTGVAGVHGDEHTDGLGDGDLITSTHEAELVLVRVESKDTKSVEDGADLGGDDGQNFDGNAVKLIETSPAARHCESHEDLTQSNVIHLV